MKRQQHPGSNPAGHADGQTHQATTSCFKTLYGKPKTLTDRYDECREVDIACVLHKPEAELRWDDFNMLYRVGVAPATYEEGLFFLPAAFAFLRRPSNPDSVDCVADVMWFISEHAARLDQDGLLEECREQVFALLHERTGQFVVVHWDREKNRQMGFDRDHLDYVEDSQLVCDMLEALLRFKILGGWSAEFLGELGSAQNAPVKSAWFLECVKDSREWALFRGTSGSSATARFTENMLAAMPQLRELWGEFQKRGLIQELPDALEPDASLLERHASVIRGSGGLFTKHPTYWNDLLGKLGLGEVADAKLPPATPLNAASSEADVEERRAALIRDIEAAFRDVERGHGLTLHEAVAFEGTDHCTAEERARVRALDPETHWQDIPDAALEECLDRWAFDDGGFRFHLPAYLRWHLRHPRGLPPGCGGMLFLQLSITGHKPKDQLRCEQSFDRFSLEQKRVIARFLEFMALEAREAGPGPQVTEREARIADLAEQAWQSYWFKFSQTAPQERTPC